MLKWKRIVWISVILIIIIPIAVLCFGKFIKSQDRGGVDEAGIKWQYNTFTKVLEFSAKESSNGKMKNYWDEEKASWWKYAKHCRKVIFGKGIKYIGKRTCSEFKQLSAVIMPDEVEEIGDYAFEYCKKLEKIKFPKGLKEIGVGAFYDTGLKTAEFNEVLGCDVWARDEKLEHICVKTLFFHSLQYAFCDVNPEVMVSVPENRYEIYSKSLYTEGKLPWTAKVVVE